jgi:FkbM family methyltransferase
MIKTIHNHTFREDLLTEGGYVLDLGCNDFVFSNYMVNRGMKVIGLDPIKNLSIPPNLATNPNFTYLQRACVGVKDTPNITYYEYQQWGANSVVNTPELLHRERNGGHGRNQSKDSYQVPTTTISDLMKEFNITQLEYIKMDIEGAEYPIIENFPDHCTKQFSVEFHDFLDLNPTDDVEQYHKDVTTKLITDYSVEYEDKEIMKSGAFQRNDVLYVLRDE